LRGQDLVSLYAQSFPPEYSSSRDLRNFLQPNLELAASLRPDLVYHLAVALNWFSRTRDSSAFREDMRFLARAIHRVQYERSRWAAEQLRKFADTPGLDPSVLQKATSLFEPYLRASDSTYPVPLPRDPVDSSRLAYYSLPLYTLKAASAFDPAVDYRLQLRDVERGVVDSMRTALAASTLTSSAFGPLFARWYLFPTPSTEPQGRVEAHDVLASGLLRELSYGPSFLHWFLSAGYSNHAGFPYTGELQREPLMDPLAFETTIGTPRLVFGLAYRIQLRPVRTFFSYLKLKTLFESGTSTERHGRTLGTTIAFVAETLPYRTTIVIDSLGSPGAEITSSRSIAFSLECSLPVVEFGNWLSIEFGAGCGVQSVNYTSTYAYHFARRGHSVWTDGTVDDYVVVQGDRMYDVHETARRWFVRPFFACVSEFLSPISLTLLVSPAALRFELGAGF
jgi:hypothetical protein